jgi:hypothetical protein
MIAALIDKAEESHKDIITLVRETDVAAQILLRSMGFRMVQTEYGRDNGLEWDYYFSVT